MSNARMNSDEFHQRAASGERPVAGLSYQARLQPVVAGADPQVVPFVLSDESVDFSAVRGGTMVAYRWNGERQVDPLHYHPHGTDLIEREPSS